MSEEKQTEKDFKDILTSGDDLFKHLQNSHSSFQIHNFILGQEQGLTVWSKYKQVLRELSTRIRSWKEADKQMKLQEIKLERAKRKVDRLKTEDAKSNPDLDLDIKEAEIELEDEQRNIVLIEKQLKEVEREGNEFTKALLALKPIIDKKLEQHTPEQLEADYWAVKLKDDLENARIGQQLGVNGNLIRTIKGIEDKTTVQNLIQAGYQEKRRLLADDIILNQQSRHLLEEEQKRSEKLQELIEEQKKNEDSSTSPDKSE